MLVAVKVLAIADSREMPERAAVLTLVIGHVRTLTGVVVIGALEAAAMLAVATHFAIAGNMSGTIAEIATHSGAQLRAMVGRMTKPGAVVAAPAIIVLVSDLATLGTSGYLAGLGIVSAATACSAFDARFALVGGTSTNAAGMTLLSSVPELATLLAMRSSAELGEMPMETANGAVGVLIMTELTALGASRCLTNRIGVSKRVALAALDLGAKVELMSRLAAESASFLAFRNRPRHNEKSI
jgi:hypothetical protein